MSTDTKHDSAASSNVGYERSDANPASLVRFAVGLALMLVVVWWGSLHVFKYFSKVQDKDLGAAVTPYEQQRSLPPLPRLQVEPVEDLVQVRAEQSDALNGYGWVDRANGIVHIPITRAMDLLLERGALPVRPNAPPAPDPGAESPRMPQTAESPRAAIGGGTP